MAAKRGKGVGPPFQQVIVEVKADPWRGNEDEIVDLVRLIRIDVAVIFAANIHFRPNNDVARVSRTGFISLPGEVEHRFKADLVSVLRPDTRRGYYPATGGHLWPDIRGAIPHLPLLSSYVPTLDLQTLILTSI